MITGWKNRGDCWTSIGSPDIVQKPEFEGYLEIPGQGSLSLSGFKKNAMGLLRNGLLELLRQEAAEGTGSFLWGYSDLSGGGGAAGSVSEVWESEAREVKLACEQSLLHQAVCDVCGTEVSHHDPEGCGQGVEVRLAHGEGTGQGVYGGAASAQSCSGSRGDWNR